MENTKKYIMGTTLAVLMASVLSLSTFADDMDQKFFGGNADGERPAFGQNLTDEQIAEREAHREEMEAQHEEISAAVLSGSYDAWAQLVEETPRGEELLEVINESNFDKFVEAHELMEDARTNMEAAQEIFTELGIERPGRGEGMGEGMKHGMKDGMRVKGLRFQEDAK